MLFGNHYLLLYSISENNLFSENLTIPQGIGYRQLFTCRLVSVILGSMTLTDEFFLSLLHPEIQIVFQSMLSLTG